MSQALVGRDVFEVGGLAGLNGVLAPWLESMWGTAVLFWVAMAALALFGGYMLWRIRQQESRRIWLAVLAMAGLGMLVRVGVIVLTQPEPVSDYMGYWIYAQRFFEGDWTFRAMDRHPGSMVLTTGAMHLLGPHYAAAWTVNVLLSGLMLVAAYGLLRPVTSPWAGLLAMAVLAVQPQLVAFTALLATEIPAVTLMLMLMWLTGDACRGALSGSWSRSGLYWVGMGFLLYAGVLTRSTLLLFVVLLPVTLLIGGAMPWAQALRRGAILVVTAGVLLSTWVYHQYLVTGVPKLFWGSEVWLMGTTNYEREGRFWNVNPDVPYYADIVADYQSDEPAARLRAYARIEQESWRILKADPVRFLQGGGVRIRHILWTSSETGIRDVQKGSVWVQTLPEKAVGKLTSISKHSWRVLLGLSLLGMLILVVRAWRWPASRPVGLLLLGFLGIWGTFHYAWAISSDRWAVQIIPLVVLLAAMGVTHSLSRLGRITGRRSEPVSELESQAPQTTPWPMARG